jgi:hypothetical protein
MARLENACLAMIKNQQDRALIFLRINGEILYNPGMQSS